ncbi:MAG: glycosyltransferase [Flavobacteriales bacterium]|nr:glycosyltransferase [Flavobacteriales bacterium]
MAEASPITLSIVVPVFDRPDEVDELLASLCAQTEAPHEVIIVEDGSQRPADEVVARYRDRLPLIYHSKPNSGPGPSRNDGFARSTGSHVLFLDSDCVLPPGYIAAMRTSIAADPADAFGGPDRADEASTPLQKAIDHAMTSFLTTGGIRGGRRSMEQFHPRSFNMGVKREVFSELRGFSPMRFGEDIDLSIRILRAGLRTSLYPDAYVYHRRRTDLRRFFKQVHNSGIARINLHKRHPGSLKAVHTLPALFTLGSLAMATWAIRCSPWWLLPNALFALALLIDASLRTRNVLVGMLAMVAGHVQLFGYGTGFLRGVWRRIILGRPEFHAYAKNFYR